MNPVHHTRTGRAHAALSAGLLTLGLVAGTLAAPSPAQAEPAPVGAGFTVTPSDLADILKQIKIAEHHAATATPANPCGTLVGSGPNEIPDRLSPYGLRTVDGSCNNLFPGRDTFASADRTFPRLTDPSFRDAENIDNTFPVGAPGPTSYKQKAGSVVDSQPRVISNLIDDQTSTNPAAVAAAGFPVRAQPGTPRYVPCTTDPDPTAAPPVVGVPAGCVPSHQTLPIPNISTDNGFSPPFNSLFTFFGQFFDHGLDQTVKGGGTVFVPLHADDPLVTRGPDGIPGNGDEVRPSQAFMVLTRAQNQPGPDGILGNGDDVQNATNTDSPWVDQSQTYASHASHQVFLREYVDNDAGRPVSTSRLLGGLAAGQTYDGSPDDQSGMSTWAAVKKQSADLLGIQLRDSDVTNVPMIATDPYGKFLPGPDRGLPQLVTKHGLVEADRAADGGKGTLVPADVLHFDTPFVADIAHNADPSRQDTDHNPATPPVAPVPDADRTPSADFAAQPAGTYDDEMLDSHFTVRRRSLQREHRAQRDPPGVPLRARPAGRPDQGRADARHDRRDQALRLAAARWGRCRSGQLERRADLPGRAVHQRDGVPARWCSRSSGARWRRASRSSPATPRTSTPPSARSSRRRSTGSATRCSTRTWRGRPRTPPPAPPRTTRSPC